MTRAFFDRLGSIARGMTAVGVGSGALLGIFLASRRTHESADEANEIRPAKHLKDKKRVRCWNRPPVISLRQRPMAPSVRKHNFSGWPTELVDSVTIKV